MGLRISFGIPLLMLAIGCATSYQPVGFGGGYSETQLAPDVFRVDFRGNGYTSAERAQDFALLRAAELTLQHGFVCFAVIDESNTARPFSISTPGQSQTTGSGVVNGNSVTYSESTTYYPGQTFTMYKPEAGLLIRAFQSKPDGIFTFDAGFLQQSLKQKYRIQ